MQTVTRCSGGPLVLCLCMGLCMGLSGLACGGDDAPSDDDAGPRDAGISSDAAIPSDAAPVLSFVEFAITGCDPPADAGPVDAGPIEPCRGPAPLALLFTAVAPDTVDTYVWSFGDGTMANTASPAHTFDDPGAYDVSLAVGGPGGTAIATRPGAVQVRPAALGARCDADNQCETGACICGEEPCAPALASGLCSAACDAAAPCDEGLCADLAPTPPANPEPWQRALCLPGCSQDADCGGDRACRALRSADGPGWVTACFPAGAPGDVGASCSDASGGFDDAACSGGLCVPEGARGLCSAPCVPGMPGTCPSGAACATFEDAAIGAVCVARCEAMDDCTGDPRLACEAPGTGLKGFSVDEPAAPMGYCAPRRCADAAECGLDGACVSGFCAPS